MNTRTTLILPDDLLQQAKLTAVHQRTTLSNLVKEALEEKIFPSKKGNSQKALSLLGKYSLGIHTPLNREEIYAEHEKHKISLR